MPAYVILIRNKTIDAAGLKVYGEKARLAMPGRTLKALAFNGALEVPEGDPAEGVVLIEFPDMAQAKAWYDSPEYEAAKPYRFNSADYRVIITDGLPG